jgi:hypothetical protein
VKRLPFLLALAPLLAGMLIAIWTPAAFGDENDDMSRSPSPTKTATVRPPENKPPDNRGDICRASSAVKWEECRKLEVRRLTPDVGLAGARLAVEIVGKGFDPDLKAALVELLPARTPPLSPRAAEQATILATGASKPVEPPRPTTPVEPPKNWPAPDAPTYPIEIQKVTPEKALGLLPAVPPGRYGLFVASGGERDYTAPAYLALSDAPFIDSIRPDVASNERPTELKIEGFNFQQGLSVTLQIAFAPPISTSSPVTSTPPISTSPPITPTPPISNGAQSISRPPLPPLPSPLVPVTGPTIVLTDGLKVEPRKIVVIVPRGLPGGVYRLTISNPDGKSDSALPGLMIIGALPSDDLAAGEIWTDPKTVRMGDEVRLGVRVKRLGGEGTLTGVTVRFYLGRPEDGAPIGTATVEPLEPWGRANASILWNTTGLSGTVGISAKVDPDDTVPELTDLNNVAGRMIRLLPPSDGDEDPPKLTSVEIDGGATTSSDREVSLAVQASDAGSGLNSLLIVERIFVSGIREWTTVRVSEWITWSAALSYTLSPDAGIHVLSVFVSDKAGNISRPMSDWVNYLPLSDTIRAGQVKLFWQDLRAGETLSVTLTTLTGDADLYLFGPGGRRGFSINPTTTVDSIVFTAEQDGRYLIEVEGFVASTYSLSWTVGSGAGRSALRAAAAAVPAGKSVRSASVGYDVPVPDGAFDAITADTRPAGTPAIGLYIPSALVNVGG